MLAAHDRIFWLNINNQKNATGTQYSLKKLTPRFIKNNACCPGDIRKKKLNLPPPSDFYPCPWGRSAFPALSPRQGRQNLISFNFTTTIPKCWCHKKYLCCRTDFSKTHRQTQRIYFWIGLDLAEVGKLLRSQLNSQILRNLHFCDQETKNLVRAVNRQPLFTARGDS